MTPVLPEGLLDMGLWFDASTGGYLWDESTAVGVGVLLFVLAVTLGTITARAVLP